jgi:hypothetical protein
MSASMLNITYAYTPYFTDTESDGRLIVGIVLHDTETDRAVNPTEKGSWHYEIDRDGALLQFVDELDCAWHVRDADRWWPEWLPGWGDFGISRANEWCIGIELVSSASVRDPGDDDVDGGPYTQAQYDTLGALLADITARRGPLWIVGHGEVQKDRSDPVQLDYQRTGLGPFEDGNGRLFLGLPESPAFPESPEVTHPTEEERIEMACQEDLAVMTADRDRLDRIRAESQNVLLSTTELSKMRKRAKTRHLSLWDYLEARAAGAG